MVTDQLLCCRARLGHSGLKYPRDAAGDVQTRRYCVYSISCKAAANPAGVVGRRCKVHVAAFPLVGTEAIEDVLRRVGQRLPAALALHRVVLLQQAGEQASIEVALPLQARSTRSA